MVAVGVALNVIDQLDVRVTRASWPTLWCRQKSAGRPFVGAPLRRRCIGSTIVRQLSFEVGAIFHQRETFAQFGLC